MKQQVYSVYDTKSGHGTPPFFTQNHDTARRMCRNLVQGTQDNDIAKNPEDFVLYHIGEFEDNSMEITGFLPTEIVRLIELTHDFGKK